MLRRMTSAAKTRIFVLTCSLGAVLGLGVLACDRLAGDVSLLDFGSAPIYAISQSGNQIVVEVVSPILY